MKKPEKASTLLVSEETVCGMLEVWQTGSVRSLYLKDKKAIQSQLDLAQKETLLLPHSRAMMSFLFFNSAPQTALLLGVGGGGILHFLCHWFPEIKITAIDNNEQIINIGKEYFALSTLSQVKVEMADAALYLTDMNHNNMDVILVDLHNGDSLPEMLNDPVFMNQCFQNLSQKGVLVINLLIENEQALMNVLVPLRKVFKGMSLCMTPRDQKNIFLFAFKSFNSMSLDALKIKAMQCQKKYDIEFESFFDDIVEIDAVC